MKELIFVKDYHGKKKGERKFYNKASAAALMNVGAAKIYKKPETKKPDTKTKTK